jgi:hypothetical protein
MSKSFGSAETRARVKVMVVPVPDCTPAASLRPYDPPTSTSWAGWTRSEQISSKRTRLPVLVTHPVTMSAPAMSGCEPNPRLSQPWVASCIVNFTCVALTVHHALKVPSWRSGALPGMMVPPLALLVEAAAVVETVATVVVRSVVVAGGVLMVADLAVYHECSE